MKKIEALIRPYRLDDVREALSKQNISGLTVTEVKGVGRQHGKVDSYRGVELVIDLFPKSKIEMIVCDEQVDLCVETIIQVARSDRIGDGKIFISHLENVIRIRTGEEDENAV